MTGLLAGLDFGAGLSGTSVLAIWDGGQVWLERERRGKPVDPWLLNRLRELKPEVLAIDAPLSLPGAYSGRGRDFHFRRSDRLLGAMSPMFLGGLTARAMALRAATRDLHTRWVETYPSQVALLRLGRHRTDRETLYRDLQAQWPDASLPVPEDQHRMDALLALWVARLVREHRAVFFGDPREGIIAV